MSDPAFNMSITRNTMEYLISFFLQYYPAVEQEVIKFVKSEQIWIATLGVMAIDFSQSKNTKLHPFASILGLLGQPFWFYMAYKNEAWGVGFLCLLYTRSWFRGFKKYWIDKHKEE